MGNMKHLLHRRLCVCLQLLKAQAFPINTQKSINVQQVQVGFGLRWLRLALGQAEEVKGRVPGCISGPDGPRPRPNDLHSLVIGDATTTTSDGRGTSTSASSASSGLALPCGCVQVCTHIYVYPNTHRLLMERAHNRTQLGVFAAQHLRQARPFCGRQLPFCPAPQGRLLSTRKCCGGKAHSMCTPCVLG